MSSRTIAIKITVENRSAISAIEALNSATEKLNDRVDKQTQLQNGLTNSFIKGNLAARAISITFETFVKTMKALGSEAVPFLYTMEKFNVITDAGSTITESMSRTIAGLAQESKLSQNELAKTALEMAKMGMSASQVEGALGGVAKLSRALDEDMKRTGEIVVSVLNAYGLSASEANKVTNEIAFTVKSSALSIESFGTAFAYVGGTAKAAGVSFEELQGAMDILSNAGIKSSTVGTQLRRIIADLSDENSKAGKVIGGNIQTYGGLEGALDALASKHLSVSDLTALFGRTASSVSDILIRYRAQMAGLAKDTGNVDDITTKMGEGLNTTLKSSLDSVAVAWKQIGIEIFKSTGFLKGFLDIVAKIMNNVADKLDLERQLDQYKKEERGNYQLGALQHGTSDNSFAEDPLFQAWKNKKEQQRQVALDVDNIIDGLKNTLTKERSVLEAYKTDPNAQPVEDTYIFKKLAAEYAGAGHTKEEFITKLRLAADKKLLEMSPAELDSKLNTGTKSKSAHLTPAFTRYVRGEVEDNDFTKEVADRRDDLTMGFKKEKVKPFHTENTEKTKETRDAFKAVDELIIKSKSDVQLYFDTLSSGFEHTNHGLEITKAGFDMLGKSVDLFSQDLAKAMFFEKDPFKNFGDSFKNLAESFVAQIIAMELRILAFKAAMSIFGFMAGPAVPGAVLPAMENPGSMSAFAAISASGTDRVVDRPTMFMAGESGKERVTITPRAKTSSSGGGSINVYIQGDVMDGSKFTEAVELAQRKLRGRAV